MQTYQELKNHIESIITKFPHFHAFNDEQFAEGLKKLNVTSKEDIISVGLGGYIHKKDKKAYMQMLENIKQMKINALQNFDFCVDAFRYELGNHECYISGDITTAIYAVGLTETMVKENEHYKKAFMKAVNLYFDFINKHNN